MSAIALLSLVITSLGVTNLLAAEVAARRHEFGVIRAIGGQRGLIVRAVLIQALMLGLVGCIIGTFGAFEVVWIRDQFDKRLLGLSYDMVVPWDAVTIGWGCVLLVSLVAAIPAAWSLLRKQPRELLGSATV
jgi:putative ABC transport system permease protein